ncbi:MAG: subclass B1 metallo-beta-lactamase [Cyclobacteriaceae bacterium]|nr:subclass B1 metallo-beta-lactamase [Cyclobacteriaceae bacterium]
MKQILLILLFGLTGYISSRAQTYEKIVIDEDIQLIHLRDSIYVHVTWHYFNDYGRFPSNGLILIKNGEALMIDTPVDNDKTGRLTRYLKDTMSVGVTTLIIGHFHEDCMGGLDYLQKAGVASIANAMTMEKCKQIGLPIPSTSFRDSLTFAFNGEQIECRFFGAGHSFDNITVWIPDKRILFGGCVIRAIDSQGLGNLSDANVNEWDATVEKVMSAYPQTKTVIPGHGAVGGNELLSHTIALVEKEKNK